MSPVTGWVEKGVFRGFSSRRLPCVVPCSSLFSTLNRSRSFSFFLFLLSLAVLSWASSGSCEGVSINGGSEEIMTVRKAKIIWAHNSRSTQILCLLGLIDTFLTSPHVYLSYPPSVLSLLLFPPFSKDGYATWAVVFVSVFMPKLFGVGPDKYSYTVRTVYMCVLACRCVLATFLYRASSPSVL